MGAVYSTKIIYEKSKKATGFNVDAKQNVMKYLDTVEQAKESWGEINRFVYSI